MDSNSLNGELTESDSAASTNDGSVSAEGYLKADAYKKPESYSKMERSSVAENSLDAEGPLPTGGSSSAEDSSPAAGSTQKKADTGPATARRSRAARLSKLAGTHSLILLLALSGFAAADSWSAISGLGIAGLLCIVTGVLAGITVTTLVHEWFHYLGARFSGGSFDIPTRQALFVYDWDFASNSVRQFLIMSVAGTVGSFVALFLLWNSIPADTWGRAALRGAVIASIVFAAFIEWPVIRRVRSGGDPLTELAKIDQPLLSRSFIFAGISGIVMTLIFVP